MLRRLFTVSFFIILIVVAFSSARAGSQKAGEEKTGQIKGPIVITSEKLLADNKAHTALFEGSVVAKSDDMTLHSDRMLVYYAEKTGNVIRIDAEGKVKLVREELVVTSKTANYFADEDKIIFTGEPRAVERGNIVTGTKMTYLLKEDRSIVENSRVLLENKKGK
jgi:lipopolysaccharide export system protein LptA